jgi:hypothetical protein
MLALLAWLALAGDVSPAIGVNIHFTGAPARDLDLIREAGFGWIRQDLFWGRVEQEKGVYRFEEYDALLDGLTARGMRAIFILDYANALYETETSVRTEAGRAAFARFAAAAAARYKGRGVYWEIWNEPNLSQFWKPEPSVDDYAALAIATAKAIRAADPKATILAPATSGIPLRFLEKLFEKGLLEHIDLLSVHPYRNTVPETVTSDYALLGELVLKHLPPGRKPPAIVSGEWGYSNAHYGGLPITEELQAAYLARELLTNLAAGILLSIWYDWANDGPDPKNTEHNFGTVTQDRKPKPAYLAAKTLTGFLGPALFLRRFEAGEGDQVLVFLDGPKTKLVAWTLGKPHRLRLEVPGVEGPVQALDITGQPSALPVKGGILELPLGRSPRYVDLPKEARQMASQGLSAEFQGDRLIVRASRSGPGTLEGRLEVHRGKPEKRPALNLALREWKPIELDAGLERWAKEPVRVSALLTNRSGTQVLAELAPRAYLPRPLLLEDLSAVLDGETKVEGRAELTMRKDVKLGGKPTSNALHLEYSFGNGQEFVRMVPKGRPEIEGRPSALSVLVVADGSGHHLRCRFQDSKGETFQSTAGDLNWTGARRVELPLDGGAATHWGGNNDGQIDYPIRWDSLLLLDSSRSPGSGSLDFAWPILIYPAE